MNNITKFYEPKGLALDALERIAPAVFATSPDARVSNSYSFIPTRPLLEALVAEGWRPTGVQSQLKGRGANAVVKPHGAHLLRFACDTLPKTEDGQLEIVLINSHDRTKRYTLASGFFRYACLNGLIAGSAIHQPIKLMHYKLKQTNDELVVAARALAARSDTLLTTVEAMRKKELSQHEALDFARRAIIMRYRTCVTDLRPDHLLSARRPEDDGMSVWKVFNRVQENMITGGVFTGRGHTRPMASLFETTALNLNLWKLAEEITQPQLALN